MTKKPVLCIAALPVTALLAACGDDLSSRQQEAAEYQPTERFIESAEPSSSPTTSAPQASPAEVSEDAAEEDEALVIDASPQDLVDSAQGLSAAPMDDAQGFDPTPEPPERFGD